MDDLDHCLSRLLVAPKKIHKGNTHMELDKVDPGKKNVQGSPDPLTSCCLRFPNAFKTKNSWKTLFFQGVLGVSISLV